MSQRWGKADALGNAAVGLGHPFTKRRTPCVLPFMGKRSKTEKKMFRASRVTKHKIVVKHCLTFFVLRRFSMQSCAR